MILRPFADTCKFESVFRNEKNEDDDGDELEYRYQLQTGGLSITTAPVQS
jgi:hypothetical protein